MSVSPLLVAVAVVALVLIGLLSGFLGIGGGIFVIPLLTLVARDAGLSPELALKQAMGTTLAVSSVTALSGFLVHRRNTAPGSSSPWPLSLSVGLAAFVGGLVGARQLGASLYALLGVAMLLAALGFALRRENTRDDPLPGGASAVLLGIAIGFCASVVGLGGAVFTGLVFSGVLGYSVRRVAATTSLAQVCGGTMGWIGWAVGGLGVDGLAPLSLGYVHLPTAVAALVLTWPAARIGARLTHRTPPLWARLLFAAVLVALGVRFLAS